MAELQRLLRQRRHQRDECQRSAIEAQRTCDRAQAAREQSQRRLQLLLAEQRQLLSHAATAADLSLHETRRRQAEAQLAAAQSQFGSAAISWRQSRQQLLRAEQDLLAVERLQQRRVAAQAQAAARADAHRQTDILVARTRATPRC
jgi:hypothetical protein